jgi:hypothetical protein
MSKIELMTLDNLINLQWLVNLERAGCRVGNQWRATERMLKLLGIPDKGSRAYQRKQAYRIIAKVTTTYAEYYRL